MVTNSLLGSLRSNLQINPKNSLKITNSVAVLLILILSLSCKKDLTEEQTNHDKSNKLTLRKTAALNDNLNINRYIFVGEDNFNGTTLDTAIWNYRGENTVRGYGVMLRSNVTLTGSGILRLVSKREGDIFSGSMISTENSILFKYGYVECRAKLNSSIGPNVGFWLQSPTNGATNNPAIDGVEVDIAEYNHAQGNNTLYHNLHWNGYGQFHQALIYSEYLPGISNGYHTFGLEWNPREYISYVDGVERARTNTAVSHRSEFIVLSMEVIAFGGNRFAGTYPDYFDIDYVKMYRLKPAVTVYGDCNYGGWVSSDINIGSYTTSQLLQLGVADNAISAIEVPAGLKITVFANDNFMGNSYTLTSDGTC